MACVVAITGPSGVKVSNLQGACTVLSDAESGSDSSEATCSAQIQSVGVRRTQRFAEAPLPATELDLPFAPGNIVGDGVTKDVGQGLFLADIFAAWLADHNGKLHLPAAQRAAARSRQRDSVTL
jgi:hypothetical protein